MPNDVVQTYLHRVLTPTMLKFGISASFIARTVETVSMQMYALLRHWEDRVFRNTVLLLGMEEGSFYEPPAKLEIRCFVVVTLRNSPLELAQSKTHREAGLSAPLTDSDVKAITAEAIRYFSKQDFMALYRTAKALSTRDLYAELQACYPLTWTALEKLATTSVKSTDYPPANRNEDATGLDGKTTPISDGERDCYKKSSKTALIPRLMTRYGSLSSRFALSRDAALFRIPSNRSRGMWKNYSESSNMCWPRTARL